MQLVDAQQKYARAKELAARSLLPQSELDAAKVAVDTAQAGVASQQATVAQTQAGVAQSQASVNQNQVNLDHTVIAAPIDGIVTQRSVDVGQTVAASMQAPTLVRDRRRPDQDAGQREHRRSRRRPHPAGQHVTFHVDAYPTETFEGTVSQVRLQPVVVQNVTTYGTVIDVPNPELKLKPGMTANVKVEIAKRTNVLRVPNAALRFRPTPEVFAALNQAVPPEVAAAGGPAAAGAPQVGQAQGRRAFGDTPARVRAPRRRQALRPPRSAPDVAFRGGDGGRGGGRGGRFRPWRRLGESG